VKHFVVVLIFAAFLQAQAGSPMISNREPKPDEVGYRPGDGSSSQLNPPSFAWLHESGAVSYEVEWRPARAADHSAASRAERLPWNTYTHSER